MGKPDFDPNQPFQPVAQANAKPAFDPTKPFQPAGANASNDVLDALHQSPQYQALKNPPTMTWSGIKEGFKNAIPVGSTAMGQVAGTPLGPAGEIAGGGAGNVFGNIVKNAAQDYQEGGIRQLLRPPTISGTIQAAKNEGQDFVNGMGQVMGGKVIAAAPGVIKDSATDFANKEAFKSLNPTKTKMVQKIIQSGEAPGIGETLRDTGVVGGIPTTRSGIAQRTNEAVESVGQQLGQKIDQIAQYADKENNLSSPFLSKPTVGLSRQAVGEALDQELMPELPKDHGIPTLNDKASEVKDLIDQFKESGSDHFSIKGAQQVKKALGDNIDWTKQPSQMNSKELFNRALYHTMSRGIEDAADVASDELGPQFANEYRTLKSQYGNLKQAAVIANKSSVGEYTNRFISPSDYGVGLFSSLSGGSPHAMAGHAIIGAIANKGARTFGNQIMSNAGAMGASIAGMGSDLQSIPSPLVTIGTSAPMRSTPTLDIQPFMNAASNVQQDQNRASNSVGPARVIKTRSQLGL